MDTLKTQLGAAGIDTHSLRTLADHVRDHFEPPLDDVQWDEPEAIYVLQAPRLGSLSLWQSLHRLMPETGRYPVILGGTDELGFHMEAVAWPQM